MIDQIYTGSREFVQMLIPPDYLKAIKNGIDAPDFKTKQKWTQSAMKLMTHKHCLFLFLFVLTEFRMGQPCLQNHGFLETGNTALWIPEDTWRDNK